ncbi:LON peptidase substrate-binding domain-containing protein [Deinococcus altitudinis]|uniref:LON peptidase substrate-binding domain-containing protein n=1 Tax=Deinococcus altitudinis TaxID=468914 RepID=UPI0038923E83
MSQTLTPLFPLPDLVLFPGLVLPLYVFEQRYRDLLADVRRSKEPFGIVRILEAGGEDSTKSFQDRVAKVGTLAHLRSVTDHDDGTASIVVVGGERFRILDFDTRHSYLSAAIQEDPLPEGPGEQDMTAALSRRLLDGLLSVRAADAGAIREHAPQEPLLLASFAATLLPLSGDQREQALDTLDLLDRLETLISFLPRNDRALN